MLGSCIWNIYCVIGMLADCIGQVDLGRGMLGACIRQVYSVRGMLTDCMGQGHLYVEY